MDEVRLSGGMPRTLSWNNDVSPDVHRTRALGGLASLMPFPIVDGGTLVKWTLVAHGRTEADADDVVRRVDWAMALASGISGVSLIATRRWAAGGALLGGGVVAAAIAAGKLR